MDIVLHSLGMPFNGETLKTKSLGGSESAAYYQARELARRGHRVTVFTSSQAEGHWDGVNYCYAGNVSESTPLGDRFEFYARNTPHDVLIIQRHPAAFHGQFASKINIWQLHDLALYRTAGMANHGMWQVDAVTCVSEWHKKQVCEVYGFDPDFVRVVPNGVDPELYESGAFYFDGESLASSPADRARALKSGGKFVMLYQSRPERGLEHLVRPGGIMDRLRETNAHLLVCGYDNTTPQMAGYYAHLNQCAAELPNVTILGALTKGYLAELQKTCDLLVYPANGFEEVSCITAMEAMHAGLPMLASECGALSETCDESGTLLIPLKDGVADEDKFVERIKELMGKPTELKALSGLQAHAALSKTWNVAVDRLEEVIGECFERRKGTEAAAIRHCVEHSDISAIQSCELDDSIIDRTKEEVSELYSFIESPEAYKAHYARHQGAYYDKFENQAIAEDVTQTTRFQGVFQLVAQEANDKGQLRVLDYGCAHGHYLFPLAKMFSNCRFVGVDVSDRAIATAARRAMADNATNVELRVGGQEVFDDISVLCPLVYDENSVQYDGNTAVAKKAKRDLFDVVIAGEVLEHVPDYQAMLENFRNVLKPGGLLIVTTPYGRWEWSGFAAFREAREHLHHFERQDIIELCGRNPLQLLYAPAGHDRTGKPMGSWVWGVRMVEPFGQIDIERKRRELCPRETVSACLIVRDGEKTLRKCVESFIDWVDEVVIAVDPTTTDRTREVIQDLESDYRWKPFKVVDGLHALEAGFDAARNRSIEHASGDWILWLDADEEVRAPWNIWKYLRPSQHKAFGFPQVHYSADPDQVLTTDYPCRLFRNRCGIKFYGLVHEHPEVEPGKAIPHSALRFDVKFLHNGYVDEEVRRARFVRNYPLLLRDIEKYPERSLNKFLLLRDIAQKLMFEHEQTRGVIVEGQREEAEKGIELFERIVEKDPVRMALDSLRYYSHCVETLGVGFDAEVSFRCAKQMAPDLACNTQFKGRFFSVDHYRKLMARIEQEATKHYESKYL